MSRQRKGPGAPGEASAGRAPPRLVHLTTTDMSLDWLLGPQLRAFAAAGYEVIGMSAPGPHVPALAEAGIRHVVVRNATRSMDPRRDVAALAELRQRFRELRPTIVHTHNPKPGLYGRLAARAAGVPVVVNTVHGLYALPEDRLAKRTVVYGLERLAATCSHAELLQNPEDLPVLTRLGVPRDRLTVLGNGVDLDRFDPSRVPPGAAARLRAELGISPDEVVVGLVGRLVAEKGYPEVFAAATFLRRRLPELRVVVVGPDDPAKPDALSGAALDAARAAGVVLLGERRDVEVLYAAFDFYVLASHREGFPRSAMEAAAMGLPLVVTDVRGCRQVVDHGRNGLLVPVRDPAGLAEAVAWLAADPGRRRALGAASRAKAEAEFDQQRVIDTTLEVYERLLAERAPAALAARRAAASST
ncbi:MAG: glycosyltransferase family 4 protein [Acidimicrobiales bacterium]|nr:glycosyltransferase family 4 protein [Acidimicrobiales bacterium]